MQSVITTGLPNSNGDIKATIKINNTIFSFRYIHQDMLAQYKEIVNNIILNRPDKYRLIIELDGTNRATIAGGYIAGGKCDVRINNANESEKISLSNFLTILQHLYNINRNKLEDV